MSEFKRISLNRQRAKYIADNWDDVYVSFEIGAIREELKMTWQNWKRTHPIKALFKSNRQKVVAILKKMDSLFVERTFWRELSTSTDYIVEGIDFSKYKYLSTLPALWGMRS